MQPKEQPDYKIAYKWLSYFIMIAAAYYWLFSISMIFFSKKISSITPKQTALYSSFIRQDWPLFANAFIYNRELNLVLRNKIGIQQYDTIQLVKYLLEEKRKYAPFNNYEDALEHLIYLQMNWLEVQLLAKKKILKSKYPGQTEIFYMQQSSILLEKDSLEQEFLNNLVSYGEYVLKHKNINTDGKEFQLSLIHKYTFPQLPSYCIPGDSSVQPVFISTFKSF